MDPEDANALHHMPTKPLKEFADTLDKSSFALLGSLACLTLGDDVPQALFEIEEGMQLPAALYFIGDDSAFNEALRPLLESGMIESDDHTCVFRIHANLRRDFHNLFSLDLRQEAFDNAAALLYSALGDEARKIGALVIEWPRCKLYLPHVFALAATFDDARNTDRKIRPNTSLCRLLTGFLTHILESYRIEDFRYLSNLCEIAIGSLEPSHEHDDANLRVAMLCFLAGKCEVAGNSAQAIRLNEHAHAICAKVLTMGERPLIALENNLGMAYGSANDHVTARIWFAKARRRASAFLGANGQLGMDEDQWLQVNLSRCLFFLSELNEAQVLLSVIYRELRDSLQCHSALLACSVHFLQGCIDRQEKRYDDAEYSFLTAKDLYPSEDPSNILSISGACMYKVAVVSLDQGKVDAAIGHLRHFVDVTPAEQQMAPAHYARGVFKLSEALRRSDPDRAEEAEQRRSEAHAALKKIDPDATEVDDESTYDRYVPICWR